MIVLDASVVVDLVLGLGRAAEIADRIRSERETLHAPHLLDLEVAQVLRRHARLGSIDARRGREALQDFADLGVERHPHDLFLARIWELRDSVSAYDAAYLALAEVIGAPLLTLDQKLARAGGHRARVEMVG